MKWFEGRDHSEISTKQISEAITAIRKREELDPDVVWSAGSTFKNLLLTEDEFETLYKNVKKNYGDEVVRELLELKDKFASVEELYKSQTGVAEIDKGAKIKIPTAFIMDRVMNLKGTSVGDAAISDKQAITIVNRGNATSEDVMKLFKKIRQLIYSMTGMKVTNEPEFMGFSQEELDYYFDLEK